MRGGHGRNGQSLAVDGEVFAVVEVVDIRGEVLRSVGLAILL